MTINQIFNFITKNPYVVNVITIFSLITLLYGLRLFRNDMFPDKLKSSYNFDVIELCLIASSPCVLSILLLSPIAKTFSDKVVTIIIICVLLIMQIIYWIRIIYNKILFKNNYHYSPLLYRFKDFK